MSLSPVREALLAEARDEAAQLVRQAQERAATQVAQAEEQKAALVGRARAEGEGAAELEAAAELAEARRTARTLILEAQRAVYEDVRREVHAAVQRIRSEARYRELVDRLAARAREELGPAAQVERDPPAGGVVGRSGKARVDHTLPALADACLAEHAVELERLWA